MLKNNSKNIVCAVVSVFVVAIAFIPYMTYAASGPATTYNVTINKVELCTDATCNNVAVVGGSKTFDIASSAAGAEIGSYAQLNTIPKGMTVTHVRVTMSRSMGIAGIIPDPGNIGAACGTEAGDASSTTVAPGLGNAGAGGTVQTLVVPDEASIFGQPPVGTYAAQDVTLISPTEMRVIKALPGSFTMKDIPPIVDLSFATSTALQAFDGNGGAPGGTCLMLPGAPIVTIKAVEQ